MAKYSCKTCGAELYFDPHRGKLHCEYCGSDFDPSEYEDTGASAEEGLPEERPQAATGELGAQPYELSGDEKADDESTGHDLVLYKCPHCGAEMITSKETAATTCVYCNRAITLEGNLKGDFRPQYVVPFKMQREDVEEAYLNLCNSSILTPREFRSKKMIEKIKGMYVPFWLYTFDGDIDLQVYGEKDRIYWRGNDQVTETSMYRVKVEGEGAFSRVPADALTSLDDAIMDTIEPFDYSDIKPFNAAYLAGFYTQRWDRTAEDNEDRAMQRAAKTITEAAIDAAGHFDRVTVEEQEIDFSNATVVQAMMPVWLLYAEYKGKQYTFGMNGQTGKIIGALPKDPGRIVKILVGTFVGSQLVMMLLRVLGMM